MRTTRIAVLLSLSLLAAACGREEAPRLDEEGQSLEGTPEMEIEVSSPSFGIINILRATGNKVKVTKEVTQPFFPVKGKALSVNGQEVQIYELGSAEATQELAATISADGSTVNRTSVHWTASPHFYRTDKVVVLYVGDDAATKQALASAIGTQFAGRP